MIKSKVIPTMIEELLLTSESNAGSYEKTGFRAGVRLLIESLGVDI